LFFYPSLKGLSLNNTKHGILINVVKHNVTCAKVK
jgi:hypothetical protein